MSELSIQFRKTSVDPTDHGEGDRKFFRVSLSSETPVDRAYFKEVLSHADGAVDLSRATSGLPLLLEHDPSNQVGRVFNVRLENMRLIGDLRISKSRPDLVEDLEDGTRIEVSIGYQITEAEERKGAEVVFVKRWTLLEASLVSIPADHTVGVNRSARTSSKGYQIMTTQITPEAETPNPNKDAEAIETFARKVGMEALGKKLIRAGASWDVARITFLEAQDSSGANRLNAYPALGAAEDPQFRELSSRVSFRDAILALAGTRFVQGLDFDPGPVTEVSQELQQRTGKISQGIQLPLSSRALTAAGQGGSMIAVEHRPDQFIDVLRNRSVVMRLAPTVIDGLVGNVSIPRKTGSTSPFWIGGDHSDALTESDVSLDNVDLTMKTVGGLTTFSHKMLKQGSPDVENMIRSDLGEMLGVELDRAAINGSGTDNEPRGILNTTGVHSLTYANGSTPDYAQIVNLEGALASSNADTGSLAYVTTPGLMSTLKSTTKVANDAGAGFVWETAREEGAGFMNGYRSFYTGNMPSGDVLFGNWRDLIVGFWGTIELMVDPYGTNFAKGSVSVRAMLDVDIAARHALSFAVLGEAA